MNEICKGIYMYIIISNIISSIINIISISIITIIIIYMK